MSNRYLHKPVWTAADISRLTEIWLTGASASRIGKKMGRTRNAVIGKLWRLGYHEFKRSTRNVNTPRKFRADIAATPGSA